jgi:hypothetical protein
MGERTANAEKAYDEQTRVESMGCDVCFGRIERAGFDGVWKQRK